MYAGPNLIILFDWMGRNQCFYEQLFRVSYMVEICLDLSSLFGIII